MSGDGKGAFIDSHDYDGDLEFVKSFVDSQPHLDAKEAADAIAARRTVSPTVNGEAYLFAIVELARAKRALKRAKAAVAVVAAAVAAGSSGDEAEDKSFDDEKTKTASNASPKDAADRTSWELVPYVAHSYCDQEKTKKPPISAIPISMVAPPKPQASSSGAVAAQEIIQLP